ncbi:MAG: flagellar basal body P-ring formation chaperone FlgA [Acetobacteraceae bacterium]
MRLSRLIAPSLAALLCAAASADAATLRTMVTLNGPHVYLRDLFDDAGPNADRLLGPGPGPGGRIIVEAAQLGAIARQFGVDWRPMSRAERSMLEWPGHPMRREDALEAVRAALIANGASADCSIEMAGFTPPIVPLDAEPMPLVAQLDYNSATGRFTAILSVTGEGMEPITTRIGGQVDETIELPVPRTRLPSGTVLRRQDVHMARVSVSQVRGEVARALKDAVGMQVRRQVLAGQPLASADLIRPAVVTRDSMVQMLLDTRGLSLSGQGVALESGATGERIRVRNTSSRAVLEAEVVAPGVVRVAPDTLPLPGVSRGNQVAVR